MILDSVLFVVALGVALGVAMAGLWMVGRGEAAGWMCVGVGAVASVAVPALVKPERRMLVSVMEALLALFVGGGFLCYADRLGATIGLNDYSVFPLLAVLWALHELSLWWSGGRWRMAAPGEGRRHTWLVVQLVVAAVLIAGAAVYVAATRTDPVALAYAALCAAMFVGCSGWLWLPAVSVPRQGANCAWACSTWCWWSFSSTVLPGSTASRGCRSRP